MLCSISLHWSSADLLVKIISLCCTISYFNMKETYTELSSVFTAWLVSDGLLSTTGRLLHCLPLHLLLCWWVTQYTLYVASSPGFAQLFSMQHWKLRGVWGRRLQIVYVHVCVTIRPVLIDTSSRCTQIGVNKTCPIDTNSNRNLLVWMTCTKKERRYTVMYNLYINL